MSVDAMSHIFKHCPLELDQKMILLVIADHADNAGGNAYPSLKTFSTYTNLSVRTVQRKLEILEESGLITREINAGGSIKLPADKRPNLYTLLCLGMTRGDTWLSPRSESSGVTEIAERGDKNLIENSSGVTNGCHPGTSFRTSLKDIEQSNDPNQTKPNQDDDGFNTSNGVEAQPKAHELEESTGETMDDESTAAFAAQSGDEESPLPGSAAYKRKRDAVRAGKGQGGGFKGGSKFGGGTETAKQSSRQVRSDPVKPRAYSQVAKEEPIQVAPRFAKYFAGSEWSKAMRDKPTRLELWSLLSDTMIARTYAGELAAAETKNGLAWLNNNFVKALDAIAPLSAPSTAVVESEYSLLPSGYYDESKWNPSPLGTTMFSNERVWYRISEQGELETRPYTGPASKPKS